MSAPAGEARRNERGQALALALLALLLASIAASLVAMDLGLRERARRDEAMRAQLRQLLDGALAEALARLAAGLPASGESLAWPAPERLGASSGARVELRRAGRADVWVWAAWGGRWAGAHADVLYVPGRDPRVLAWRRLPSASARALAGQGGG